MEASAESLDLTLDALFAGSLRTRPSPPPRMFWPIQLRTRKLRAANIGANTDFRSVSPVFPSLPAYGTPRARASSSSAGQELPKDGVKLTYGRPRSRAA